MPNQNQRPTLASVSQRIDALDAELERARAVRGQDVHEAQRTRRGATRANMRAEQAHRRVDAVEERTGLLETTAVAILDRLSVFAGFFRTQQADLADHEERITNHQVRINSLERRAEADDNIVGVWAITVTIVEVFLFLAWLVMADWKNGLNQRLADTPSYDSIFIWLAIGSAIVISLVALCIYLMRDGGLAVTRRSTEQTQQPVEGNAEPSQPNLQEVPRGNDEPTQVMPVVGIDETLEMPAVS